MKTLKEKIDEANNNINELNEVNKTIYSTLKDFKMSDNKAKVAIERMASNNSAIKKQENIIKKLNTPK